MSVSHLLSDLISSLTAIIAVLVAALISIRGYYRQREYELVQKRYLEEGLDVVISTAEAALNVYSHNWARCTEILKAFRDLENVDPTDLDRGFLALPESRFALTANYRVNTIVGSDLVWYTFQLVLAFAQKGITITRDEIPSALKTKLLASDVEATRDEIVEEAEKVLVELNGDSERFHIFVGQMQRVAALFEQQRFRFGGVRDLNDHETVRDVLKNLRETFSDKLEEHGKLAT